LPFDSSLARQSTYEEAAAELGSDWGAAVEPVNTFFPNAGAVTFLDSHLAFCNLMGYVLSGDPWIQTQGTGKVF
jgi:hypothetical protein